MLLLYPRCCHCHPLPPLYSCSYATFVDGLEACSRDNLEFVKDRAIKTLFELLLAKPEQVGPLPAAFRVDRMVCREGSGHQGAA